MSAVLIADDRQGPEAHRIPEHGSVTIDEKNNAETPDTTAEINKIRESDDAKRTGKPAREQWAPEGFYWGYNKQGDPVLKPSEWYVKDIAKDADARFIAAMNKHSKSTELKERIECAAAALKEYLLERRAINDKSFARRMKAEADDAAYQIVQAAKYRKDGMQVMANNRSRGYAPENQKTKDLRNWMENSMYEGYALTNIVLKAAEGSDFVPVFDYEAAAWRVCNFSAQRLTETLMAKARNDAKADDLNAQAAQTEAEHYFE